MKSNKYYLYFLFLITTYSEINLISCYSHAAKRKRAITARRASMRILNLKLEDFLEIMCDNNNVVKIYNYVFLSVNH